MKKILSGSRSMSFLRAIICLLCPPLAVLDRGCGAITIVTVLTIVGWIPGVIAAIIFSINNDDAE